MVKYLGLFAKDRLRKSHQKDNTQKHEKITKKLLLQRAEFVVQASATLKL